MQNILFELHNDLNVQDTQCQWGVFVSREIVRITRGVKCFIHAESSGKDVIGWLTTGQTDKERGRERAIKPSTELDQQNDAGHNAEKDKSENDAVTVQSYQESNHADSFVQDDASPGGHGGTNVGQQAEPSALVEHASGPHADGTDNGDVQKQNGEPSTRENPVVHQEISPSVHSTTNNIPEARVSPGRTTVQTTPKVQGWINKELK